MSKSVVLIAEDFEYQHQPLINMLNGIGVETITCSNTAVSLEVAILKYTPYIVIFNSSSLGMTSVKALINNVKFAEISPIYYNIYSYEDPETLIMLENIGVGINISLPYKIDMIASHIKLIMENMPLDIDYFKDMIHERLTEILSKFNMTARQHGREYIINAIMYILFENRIRANFNGEIYPCVAAKHNTKSQCVEHSIRIAIEKCWKNTDEKIKFEFFPEYGITEKKPTNSKFILTIANYVQSENIENFIKIRRDRINNNL